MFQHGIMVQLGRGLTEGFVLAESEQRRGQGHHPARNLAARSIMPLWRPTSSSWRVGRIQKPHERENLWRARVAC